MNEVDELLAHAYLYYVECSPVISDEEYDHKYRELNASFVGSDREADYPQNIKEIASKIKNR